jgi:hypothetical protein
MNGDESLLTHSKRPVICPHCNATIENVQLKIARPKLLIVEGSDEENFFGALLKHLEITDVQVAGIGGKSRIRPRLKALVNDADFIQIVSLGIIRDADVDPKTAFQSIRDALKNTGLPFPTKPLRFVKGPPKVGVMILPAPDKKGALEELCLQAIKDDPAMSCVGQYFKCLEDQGVKTPKKGKLSKAKTRVFLASREEPTLAVGTAALRGYWPFGHKMFSSVRNFLKSL